MEGKTVLKILKAHNGDSFILKTYTSDKRDFTILVDGGTSQTFSDTLKNALKQLKQIDLLILTHIDSDHIAGLLKFFKSSLFDSINIQLLWINLLGFITVNSGEKVSMGQAKSLEELMVEKMLDLSKIVQNVTIENQPKPLENGIEFLVLSPRSALLEELKKDAAEYLILEQSRIADRVKVSAYTVSASHEISLKDLAKSEFRPQSINSDKINSSSIGVLITTFDGSCLLLGDCRSEIIEQSLLANGYSVSNRLKVNIVKVSHHGSANNTSCSLLDIIDCNHFVISTNGGTSHHHHPDREVIARIVHHPKRDYAQHRTIYFNYPMEKIIQRSGSFILDGDLVDGNWSFVDDVDQLVIRELA